MKLTEMRAVLKQLTKDCLVGWIGQRALDCVGLSKLLPLDFIVSCDYGTDIAKWGEDKFFLSIEKTTYVRQNWSNQHLEGAFKGSIGDQFENFRKNKNVKFACYRSVEYLENLKKQASVQNTVAAVSLGLKNYFDNKLVLYKKLPDLGLRVIPGEITKLSKTGFDYLQKKYGLPFVVQLPIGSSGNNTFFIFNKAEFIHIAPQLTRFEFKVSRYLPNYSLNLNCAIYQGKTYLSAPSIQIVGVPECTTRPSIFCGNDFTAGANLSIRIVQEAFEVAQKIASWMISKGYRGVFGLDLLVTEDQVYLIEINPRLQNSTDVLTISQVQKEQVPLIGFHLLEFFDRENQVDPEMFSNLETYQLQQGTQIILHNLERKTVINRCTTAPGIYTFELGKLVYQRPGISLFDCKHENEFLINCGVLFKNQVILKNAPLCKIQSFRSLLKADRVHLNTWASSIAREVYKQFELCEYSDKSKII